MAPDTTRFVKAATEAATEADGDAGRPGPARPLRRDAERNRRRILASAREVFAARGVDVTLDDIAHHAGVGVGTVYRRFPSREHLVEALFDEDLDQIVAWAGEGIRARDAWAGLTGFLERSVTFMSTDRGLQDVLFSHAYGRQRVARIRERIAPAVDALIARCQRVGVVRDDVVGGDIALVQFMVAALMEYTEHVEPGLWRRYLALVLDGLRTPSSALPVAAPTIDILTQIAERWRPPRRHGSEPSSGR
ncbi:TetR/AcrR family transcriptional regulator [Virgisporangium aurantiacum]|uniref:TetR family transcriptional regulator n=1 Tax=Virgisporangium aurantiacum TaxID=175570 RepID=A0A8J3ZIB6_9ACTN|nr:TetR/AcrR family transcriptional regulator [Virgisporangium aurantiacum]GIJ64336.1 TetR family transcriptional regulator [Virgisporangium aurantiacum]